MLSLPLFVKMKALQVVTVLIILASCRSSRNVTEAATRSLEMTDRLEAVQGRQLDRVLTTETIIMKPDTVAGKLAVVHRSVTRTTETVRDTATAVTESKSEAVEESKAETREVAVKAKADPSSWIIPAVFIGYIILAIFLILYIAKLFEKWTLRH